MRGIRAGLVDAVVCFNADNRLYLAKMMFNSLRSGFYLVDPLDNA